MPPLRGPFRSENLAGFTAGCEATPNSGPARRGGSVHANTPAPKLRPRLIAAVERGMERVAPS